MLAGDIAVDDGEAEPALVLTSPSSPEAGNGGLLRASDIATLKLNAGWVVLSACNTAAGSSLRGEAMSGLASAFFYAGSHALLVSHWPVDSEAAVLLTTGAFLEIAAKPETGRALAMRHAMEALMEDPSGPFAQGHRRRAVWKCDLIRRNINHCRQCLTKSGVAWAITRH